jgi:peptidoglycan/LPS O-acetylase OafA/YrhL
MVFMHHTLVPKPSGGAFQSAVISIKYGSALGVPLFFMLSSYLITELLLREKSATGTVHIGDFYVRRILRIWPLYFTCLISAVFIGILWPEYHAPWGGVAAYTFLAGNWYFGAHPGTPLPPLAIALWSVSLEEQFYVLFPSAAKKLSVLALGIVASSIWIAAQFWTWYLASHGRTSAAIRLDTFVQFQFFALGTLLAIGMKGRLPHTRTALRWVMGLSGIALVYSTEFIFHALSVDHPAIYAPTIQNTLTGLGFLCVLLAFLGMGVPSAFNPIRYLGKISYGLYAFHSMLIVLAYRLCGELHFTHGITLVVYFFALPATILTAHLSYVYLESPFLKIKERYTIIRSRGV